MADDGGICVCGDLASFEHLPVQVAEANALWEQTEQVLLQVQGRCSSLGAALGKSARLACEFWNLQQDSLISARASCAGRPCPRTCTIGPLLLRHKINTHLSSNGVVREMLLCLEELRSEMSLCRVLSCRLAAGSQTLTDLAGFVFLFDWN